MRAPHEHDLIRSGDLVIILVERDLYVPQVMHLGESFHTRRGYFKHDDIIGKAYGSKIETDSHNPNVLFPYIHVLKATPLLWTRCLLKRTQILFETDIAMVIYKLGLKNGSKVVESGTGSGSLSHSILTTIAPAGHLYTFEFHEGRVNHVSQEFSDHQLKDFVTLVHGDASEGFSPTVSPQSVDAVFLDLPRPWEAIRHAHDVLRVGGRLCTFSPCIEQVQRTMKELHLRHYGDIECVECLAKNYGFEKVQMRPPFTYDHDSKALESHCIANDIMRGHTSYLVFAKKYNVSPQ